MQDTDSLIVPTVSVYEVFKVVLRESGEIEALQAIAAMQEGSVIDLSILLRKTAEGRREWVDPLPDGG